MATISIIKEKGKEKKKKEKFVLDEYTPDKCDWPTKKKKKEKKEKKRLESGPIDRNYPIPF